MWAYSLIIYSITRSLNMLSLLNKRCFVVCTKIYQNTNISVVLSNQPSSRVKMVGWKVPPEYECFDKF